LGIVSTELWHPKRVVPASIDALEYDDVQRRAVSDVGQLPDALHVVPCEDQRRASGKACRSLLSSAVIKEDQDGHGKRHGTDDRTEDFHQSCVERTWIAGRAEPIWLYG
jgi:hypothetical protein